MNRTEFSTPITTAEEALTLAGLDWSVKAETLVTAVNYKYVPNHRAIINERTGNVLGVVGNKYSMVQNDEAFRPFDEGIKMMGGHYTSAGYVDDGHIVFAQAEVGQRDFGDGDNVKKYLTLITRHDGGGSVLLSLTPIRIVCQNTLAMVISGSRSEFFFRVRHSGATEDKIQDLIVSKIPLFLEKYQVGMDNLQELVKIKAEEKDSIALLDLIAPTPASVEDISTKLKNKREILLQLMFHGTGQEMTTAAGTLWGLYNGITEYFDHYYGRDEDTRFKNNADGIGNLMKIRAVATVARMAKSRGANIIGM